MAFVSFRGLGRDRRIETPSNQGGEGDYQIQPNPSRNYSN
ncbi:hypothetical protein SLEP1_g55448 [Rubroshorea leprosula]|uniref:Uncharacterized protein n=1 Tax=Rubroshorea leprosula TaxID=152421 RepID=A0AAV5MGC7_9ROSI|nr:hypothetical protein SLEP1_g55448 [Rubroshorea leprosula]